jgi:predicted RNA-binding protein
MSVVDAVVVKGTGDEVFPLRVRLRGVEICDPPVSFKPLIPKLAFITNRKQWSGHIRGQAMRKIPEEDYLYIMKAAEMPRGERYLSGPKHVVGLHVM